MTASIYLCWYVLFLKFKFTGINIEMKMQWWLMAEEWPLKIKPIWKHFCETIHWHSIRSNLFFLMHETTTRVYLDKHFKAIELYITRTINIRKKNEAFLLPNLQRYSSVNSRFFPFKWYGTEKKPVFIHLTEHTMRFRCIHKPALTHTQSLASILRFLIR